MISFPAPALRQGADEDLVVEIGTIVFPGCIRRWPDENGLRLWAEGDPADPAARMPTSRAGVDARAKFQTVLGVLRAWWSSAGELSDERRAGLGEESIRDETGNQWVIVAQAIEYGNRRALSEEIEKFAAAARRGVDASQSLKNALWINGRQNRTAADFYMVHQYAEEDFGGTKEILAALGLSVASQKRLTKSASNLSPLAGGRKARGNDALVVMNLDDQREYIAKLLRLWIEQYD